nr:class I mannose-6-phosphate isomerase [Polymorphobacter sp.]
MSVRAPSTNFQALETLLVEKPWGRLDLPAGFPSANGKRIGEIEHRAIDGAPAPLLAKHIFTSERLSIQVHPGDDQARARGLSSGKTECWLILAAEPGAVIGIGGNCALTPDALHAAALDGSIEHWLDWRRVAVGDFFLVPAGTIHAIGAGITLVEIQQNVAATYRLFDYGRPRALHLGDGVAVAHPAPYPAAFATRVVPGDTVLADIPQFQIRYRTLPGSFDVDKNCLVIPITGLVTIDGVGAAPGRCFAANAFANVHIGPDAAILIARSQSALA